MAVFTESAISVLQQVHMSHECICTLHTTVTCSCCNLRITACESSTISIGCKHSCMPAEPCSCVEGAGTKLDMIQHINGQRHSRNVKDIGQNPSPCDVPKQYALSPYLQRHNIRCYHTYTTKAKRHLATYWWSVHSRTTQSTLKSKSQCRGSPSAVSAPSGPRQRVPPQPGLLNPAGVPCQGPRGGP